MTNRKHYKFHEGMRVYYTGDNANASDLGTVQRVDRYVTVRLDDGRMLRGIFPSQIEPGPGRRFLTKEEYDKGIRQ